MSDQLDSDQPSQSQYPSPSPPEFPPPNAKRCRSDSDLENDPAFFISFSGHDIIHRILTNPVPTPYQGAVAVPAAGTGVSVSYRRFLDRVGTKVGMSQENFTTDMRRQREPGVFHGLQQHLADKFENELDCYAWNLGGLSAGKLYYKVVPTGAGSTTVVQKGRAPFTRHHHLAISGADWDLCRLQFTAAPCII